MTAAASRRSTRYVDFHMLLRYFILIAYFLLHSKHNLQTACYCFDIRLDKSISSYLQKTRLSSFILHNMVNACLYRGCPSQIQSGEPLVHTELQIQATITLHTKSQTMYEAWDLNASSKYDKCYSQQASAHFVVYRCIQIITCYKIRLNITAFALNSLVHCHIENSVLGAFPMCWGYRSSTAVTRT
jgi:hypothetical protein